jgi:hypothetical protein
MTKLPGDVGLGVVRQYINIRNIYGDLTPFAQNLVQNENFSVQTPGDVS